MTQNNLGSAYCVRIRGEHADNLEAAIAAFEAALTVFTREALPLEWAQTQVGLGAVYHARIRGERADNIERAIAACEAALTVFTREALPRDHRRASCLLGEVQLGQRQWRGALEAFMSARQAFLLLFGQGLNEAEVQDLISKAGSLFSDGAYAASEAGNLEGAFQFLDEGKARLLAVALRQRALPLSPDGQARLEALQQDIRSWTRLAETAQGIDVSHALARLSALRQELGKLVEDALAKAAPRASLLERAAKLTGANGAVVAPLVTETGGKMLIVSCTNGQSAIKTIDLPHLTTARLKEMVWGPVSQSELGGWLGAYIKKQWPAAVDAIAPELWSLVGGPSRQELERLGVTVGGRLIWMPTGALGILPIGLAEDPATGERLGETYEIIYAPSIDALTAALTTAETARQPMLAAIAPPTDLKSTHFEVKTIASHFPQEDRVVLEKEATAAAVLSALRGRNYWHFATHGKFDWENARRSYLELENKEQLSVGMLGDADGLSQPRMVSLSACETGIYEFRQNADEFIGLPGAFMALGAAGVLGSLWPVEDRATALLMTKFYELHLDRSEPLPPPAALKLAQAWLRQATKAELIAYASSSGKKAGIEALAKTFEASLMRGEPEDPRWAALTKLVQNSKAKLKAGQSFVGRLFGGSSEEEERPFAHPYYWGGFVYTGL